MNQHERAGTRRRVPDDQFGGRLSDCFFLDLEVVAVAEVGTQRRRIRFASTDLVDFAWQPGQDVMFQVPDIERSVRRRVTIRRADPAMGTLDAEVVVHGAGPLSRWAETVGVGDRIEGIGPRGVPSLRQGAAQHLFFVDNSGLPATHAIIESLPSNTQANVTMVEVREDLALDGEGPHLEVTVESIAAADLDAHVAKSTLTSGAAAYVFGERSMVNSVRAALESRGLRATDIVSKAYWRRDRRNAPHGEPDNDGA